MIRTVIKLGLVLVVGILAYNYFLGTPEEKAQSQKVFDKVEDVFVSVGGLLKSEKEKFDAGKYDEALDRIGTAFDDLKNKAQELQDEDYLGQLRDLEEKRDALQNEVNKMAEENDITEEFTSKGERRSAEKLENELKDLMGEAKTLMRDMERSE